MGLVVGFYALSIAVAGTLLSIVYLDVTQVRSSFINLKLILICLMAAGTILWSILPRFERFEAPGPELQPEKEPRLFEEIKEIAQRSGQPVPQVVYLCNDMNAGVFQRGGLLTGGKRSVLVLGLPLICVTTVSQFRAIMAHEFGHFYGGDTKLAPWIYKTTKAIIRTLNSLAERGSHLTFLFEWYGKLFLRTTRSISRHQEFAADALGARLAGSNAMQEGLRALHRFDVLSTIYWQSEVEPVIESGFRPPLADGFNQFVAAPTWRELLAEPERKLTAAADDDDGIYDTHPPLEERIAALKSLPEGEVPESDPCAVSLFDHLDSEEERLIGFLQKAESKLKPIAWKDTGNAVYVPKWRQIVQPQSKALAGVSAASIAQLNNLNQFWESLRNPPGRLLARDERKHLGLQVLGAALALALYERGWELCALPGTLELQHNGTSVSPFSTVFKISSGKITSKSWLETCKQAAIVDLNLSQTETGASAAAH